MNNDEIVDFLQSTDALHEVPRDQLEWLFRESEIMEREVGIFSRPGEPFDYLLVILEGRIEAYVFQNGQKRIQQATKPGSVTGNIPFSRMKSSEIYVDVVEHFKALALHRSKFHDLISHNYELTEVLVHTMIDRVRLFTSAHFQNEKLMALGKLSAGLSHELNNPAAAVLRSAEDLKQIVGSLDTKFREITSLHFTETEITTLTRIVEKISERESIRLPLLERKRLEDEVADWLADNDLTADCEETFVAEGIRVNDLEEIKRSVSNESFRPFVNWLSSRLQTEKAVEEIEASSRRISELVSSVKSYTRMDQAHAMDSVCINEGIGNTITMLEYKARRQSITIHTELEGGLPEIIGFPGELNQVWTNIIDNSIDAMKDGGELTIRTATSGDQVLFSAIDTGPGIPKENLERIFDPFFTTKDVGEGTGVGLDIVRKIVQQHSGLIDVNSRPGRTEFTITFPANRVSV